MTDTHLVPTSIPDSPAASHAIAVQTQGDPPLCTSSRPDSTCSSCQHLFRSLAAPVSNHNKDRDLDGYTDLADPASRYYSSYILPSRKLNTPVADTRYSPHTASYSPVKKATSLDEDDKVITGPFNYVYGLPGKNIRAQMINAFNAWLEVPSDSLQVIADVIGMLHTASLLVDDVEDSSLLRRGFPVAHNIFGVPQTINSANYMYFRALEKAQTLKSPDATRIFVCEVLQLHRGQGMDLYWRDSLVCPTEREYLDMVGKKTGGLFRLAVKLMQAESPKTVPQGCVPLADKLGLLFQIRDDYQNLNSEEYSDSKGMCEDLTEGKFSFPVIHSIRHDPTNLQLHHILRLKTTDLEVKRYAVKYMEGTGSFQYTSQRINALITQARCAADEIDGRSKSRSIHELLDGLVI